MDRVEHARWHAEFEQERAARLRRYRDYNHSLLLNDSKEVLEAEELQRSWEDQAKETK